MSMEELMSLAWLVKEMAVLDSTNQEFTLMYRNLEVGSTNTPEMVVVIDF